MSLKKPQKIDNVNFIFVLTVILLLITSFMHLQSKTKKNTEILFPEKESMKKQSEIFFKKIDTQHPLISKVDFFTRSEAYLSAYLNLTVYIIKNNYIKSILPLFAKDNTIIIEKYNKHLKRLKIENAFNIQKELKISRLKLYLLTLNSLYREYNDNKLSGNHAYILWNILLTITEEAYKKKKEPQYAAILKVSSHFVFFKQHKKWLKRANKFIKKINPMDQYDSDIKLIFSTSI